LRKIYVSDIRQDSAAVFKFLVDYEKRTGKRWFADIDGDGYFLAIEDADDAMVAFLKFS